MKAFHAKDLSYVFLSYDEPNADYNFQKLLEVVPWAVRSHGVKGFDAAHKAAADKASTNIFVTVDADSIIDPVVLDVTGTSKLDSFAISTCGRNSINGLCYGNGGLKFWTKSFVYDLKSHENAEGNKLALDFCWHPNYFPTHNTVYCTTIPNSSEYHAWRAGVREGVKMMENYKRLGNPRLAGHNFFLSWCCLGADSAYGHVAMDATIFGAYKCLFSDSKDSLIADYDSISILWEEFQSLEEKDFLAMRKRVALVYGLADIPKLSAEQSLLVKELNSPPYINKELHV